MIDAIEDAAVILLVATGSLAALSLAAWLLWAWLADDPLGINGCFRGE